MKNLDFLNAKKGRGQERCGVCRNWHYNCYVLPKAINGTKHLCQGCFENAKNVLNVISDEKHIFQQLEKKSMVRGKRRNTTEKKKMNNLLVKAKPYIDLGLPEEFALSCAKSPETSDSVLDLWEATWWKQYEPEDPMITSVLNGQFTEEQAKWMNTFRSDHPDLVWALLNKSVTVEWATALLDSGFQGNIDQVSAALAGASPKIIARISKLDCTKDLIPPSLDSPANCLKPDTSRINREPENTTTFDSDNLILHIPEVEKIINTFSKSEAKNEVKSLGLKGISEPKRTLKNAVNLASDFNSGIISLEKTTDWNDFAAKLNIQNRSTFSTKELQRVVKKTCAKIARWAINLLKEKEE